MTFLTVWKVVRQQSWYVIGSVADADGKVLTPDPLLLFPRSYFIPAVVALGSDHLAVYPGTSGVLHTNIISPDAQAVRDGPPRRPPPPRAFCCSD